MKPLTNEWIAKAEGDHGTATRETQVTRNPNYDAVCFHAQQCAEKYLKARLQEMGISFGKTHDLSVLLDRIVALEARWEDIREDVEALTVFASEFRYPGKAADQASAQEALTRCNHVRTVARSAFGLSP